MLMLLPFFDHLLSFFFSVSTLWSLSIHWFNLIHLRVHVASLCVLGTSFNMYFNLFLYWMNYANSCISFWTSLRHLIDMKVAVRQFGWCDKMSSLPRSDSVCLIKLITCVADWFVDVCLKVISILYSRIKKNLCSCSPLSQNDSWRSGNNNERKDCDLFGLHDYLMARMFL